MYTSNPLIEIIAIAAIILFFVMAVALHNISKNVRNINRFITGWGTENGYGIVYTCKKCKKPYSGKQAVCPYCGDVKSYT
jgi:hypothetical protein